MAAFVWFKPPSPVLPDDDIEHNRAIGERFLDESQIAQIDIDGGRFGRLPHRATIRFEQADRRHFCEPGWKLSDLHGQPIKLGSHRNSHAIPMPAPIAVEQINNIAATDQ